MQAAELLAQVVRHDADKARRQPALRHEGGAGAFGQAHDLARGADVLGQVEIVATRRQRLAGDQGGQVVGQGVDDHFLPHQAGAQGAGVGRVQHRGLQRQVAQGFQRISATVHHLDLVVATAGQETGNGVADVACTHKNYAH